MKSSLTHIPPLLTIYIPEEDWGRDNTQACRQGGGGTGGALAPPFQIEIYKQQYVKCL